MKNNPDVIESGMDPYEHYQQHGRFEGRLGHCPKVEIQAGSVRFEPSKDTVLVVSHEASLTGAPILSLNISLIAVPYRPYIEVHVIGLAALV